MSDVNERGNLNGRFWLKVAGIGFGAWSLMLPVTAGYVRDGMRDLGNTLREEIVTNRERHSEYERELTRLDTNQKEVMRRLGELEAEVHNGKR